MTLESIERVEQPARVYNFEVRDLHTYLVGRVGVVVHNCGVPRWRRVLGKGPETSAMREFTPTRNLASTNEPTSLYEIRVNGKLRKVGIISVPEGPGGLLQRPLSQVKRLQRKFPGIGKVEYRVRKVFESRELALKYEKKLLQRFKRLFGEYPGEGLPGGNRVDR